jgi:hypothetical protein
MITLPDNPRPNRMTVDLLDFGFTQRGAASLRVNRPGGRYSITLSWPAEIMRPPVTQTFTSKLKRAKRQGVQIDLLLPVDQGSPGSPVVNGAGQSGSAISIRGFLPGYFIGEDFFCTIVEADGTAYLHSVFSTTTANVSGIATVQIEPPLRAPFPDGAVVEFAEPFVQGELVGETFSYGFEQQRQTPLTITIEEFQ